MLTPTIPLVARVHTVTLHGIDSISIEVQATCTDGPSGIKILGLREVSARESRVRVRAALEAAGLPLLGKFVQVTVLPADVVQASATLDLPIALAALAAVGVLPAQSLEGVLIMGELGLDESLRAVRGVLAHLQHARREGLQRAIVPVANAQEAALLQALTVRCAGTLSSVVAHLQGHGQLPSTVQACQREEAATRGVELDLADVRGNAGAKRALEIAAAGGHSLLLRGPLGCGKTMLAQRLPGLLPKPTHAEALQIASIQSAAGLSVPTALDRCPRPFRAPHHSVSHAGLFGAGSPPRPGEVTLAHGGVLFLDELTEFRRALLAELQTVMGRRQVRLARAGREVRWPAALLCVAALTPCGCGAWATPRCTCNEAGRERHLAPVATLLSDHFDLQVEVAPRQTALVNNGPTESSQTVRQRIEQGRAFAAASFGPEPLSTASLATQLAPEAAALLKGAADALGFTPRRHDTVLRVARTIADLAASWQMEVPHIEEALAIAPGPLT